eukprot:3935803-Rhodomonas_salina.1
MFLPTRTLKVEMTESPGAVRSVYARAMPCPVLACCAHACHARAALSGRQNGRASERADEGDGGEQDRAQHLRDAHARRRPGPSLPSMLRPLLVTLAALQVVFATLPVIAWARCG